VDLVTGDLFDPLVNEWWSMRSSSWFPIFYALAHYTEENLIVFDVWNFISSSKTLVRKNLSVSTSADEIGTGSSSRACILNYSLFFREKLLPMFQNVLHVLTV
jgi:hypothetical protein